MSVDEVLARQAWLAAARWTRERLTVQGASDDAAGRAFDAWWARFRPSPQRIPDDAPSWWHGHGPARGLRLYDRRGFLAKKPALDTLQLDGGYTPPRIEGEDTQGQFLRTVVTSNGDVFTIISWWDRSHGDATEDSNSCFIVRGDHAFSSEAMIDAFMRHFPWQAAQLAGAHVQLVEVDPAAF